MITEKQRREVASGVNVDPTVVGGLRKLDARTDARMANIQVILYHVQCSALHSTDKKLVFLLVVKSNFGK